jgi:acetoacetate decarboxylase
MSFIRPLDQIEQKNVDLRTSNFTNVKMLTALWDTKPEIIKKILPPPLEPAERPLVMAFIADYEKTNQGQPYQESALFIRVKFKEEYGNYFLAMHVTDDRAMIGGREVFGFPKKMAAIKMERVDTKVHAWSERLGTRTIDVKANFSGKFNDPEAGKIITALGILPSRKKPTVNFNFKHFPSADKTGFDYNPLLIRQETLVKPKNFEMGEAEIVLGSSVHDPWGELEVVRPLGSLFIYSDNIMQPGQKVFEVADPKAFVPYSFIKGDWY